MFLTRSFHKRKHVATATLREKGSLNMQRASRLAIASLLAMALAACATTPPPDLTPPPAKRPDAKTTLEGRR
jgi:hypothetical protein